MAKRKRKLDRSVTCKIVVKVAGKPVKTVKRNLSVFQAVREIGRDPLVTEGQMRTGQPVTLRRAVTPAVRVEITYTGDAKLDDGILCRVNTGEAVGVIRDGIPL